MPSLKSKVLRSLQSFCVFCMGSSAVSANQYYMDIKGFYVNNSLSTVPSSSSTLLLNQGDTILFDSTGLNNPVSNKAAGSLSVQFNIDSNSITPYGSLNTVTGSNGNNITFSNALGSANKLASVSFESGSNTPSGNGKGDIITISSTLKSDVIYAKTGSYNNFKVSTATYGCVNFKNLVYGAINAITGDHNQYPNSSVFLRKL